MAEFEGRRQRKSLFESFRDIYLERLTGVLRMQESDHEARLYFVGGDLYLPPDHEVAIWAYQWLSTAKARQADGEGEPDTDEAEESSEVLEESSAEPVWAEKLIEGQLSVDEGNFDFEEGAQQIPLDLVGPLPTASLVMRLAVADRDELQLLRDLGGEEQRYVVETDSDDSEGLPDLDPLEAFFLSRLQQATPVRELLRQTDESRDSGLRSLCRLRSIRLIVPEDLMPARAGSELVSPQLLEKFESRIGDSLATTPLGLDADTHRRRLVELLGSVGGQNFYQLLGVALGCSAEEFHQAYTELARIVHPAHAEALGLTGKEEALRLLFEKATEAYLTLSDPERSRRYQLSLGDSAVVVAVQTEGPQRKKEEKELAEQNYRAAKNMALQNDYFSAIQLLEQAVRSDPQPEYHLLLAQCQAQNPRWINKAVFNCSLAVELKPDDPQLRTALGEIYEKAGNLARAREEYQSALARMPGHPEASEALERMIPLERKEKRGLLGRFFPSQKDE